MTVWFPGPLGEFHGRSPDYLPNTHLVWPGAKSFRLGYGGYGGYDGRFDLGQWPTGYSIGGH